MLFFIQVVGIILCLIVVSWVIDILLFTYYSQKAIWGLPYLKWLTVEDLPTYGIPKFMGKSLLPIFFEHKIIETRPRSDLDAKMTKRAKHGRLNRFNNNLFEFRLMVKPPRRKKWFTLKEILKRSPDFDSDPVPVPI